MTSEQIAEAIRDTEEGRHDGTTTHNTDAQAEDATAWVAGMEMTYAASAGGAPNE